MLAKGGFAVKCWQFTGESSPCTDKMLSANSDTVVVPDGPASTHTNMLKGTDSNLRVLCLGWNPVEDTVVFEVTINFSKKKKGIYTGPNVKKADLLQGLPLVLTRRIVLSQVMMIFDPLGFVCPYTLLGKIYLWETWSLKPGWHDQQSRRMPVLEEARTMDYVMNHNMITMAMTIFITLNMAAECGGMWG